MNAEFVAFDSEITKLAMCQDSKSISADAPPSRWGTRSGFFTSLHHTAATSTIAAGDELFFQRLRFTAVLGSSHTSLHFSKSSSRASPAAPGHRCTRPLPHFVSVSPALAAASRWAKRPLGRHEAAGTLNLCVSSSRITNFASKPSLDAPKSPFEISIT
ncbi:hypothetical protein Bca52824_046484 [Brassica carinata]|uniref:Uncharacterized protein n=1 Tax=Brassica carinata TaxID=52824 RepID=A0A8X7REM4_BRACI|nr:hypothetical protein Bca52824_046484 [Brassica carinata]